jgi:hypothetical protein
MDSQRPRRVRRPKVIWEASRSESVPRRRGIVAQKLAVEATNSYAARHLNSSSEGRSWHPMTVGELHRYLGVWVYLSRYPVIQRLELWSETHCLGRYISLKRFEQIHRFFSLRDAVANPPQSTECFAWKLEPIATKLRVNCMRNWRPGTHVAIDESMIPFMGRSKHKVKMKNKPIDEGYKIWVLAQAAYVIDWRWHTRQYGPEGVDNLFLNIPVAHRLLEMDILCILMAG